MNPGRQTVSSAEREAESRQQRGTQWGTGGARGRQNAGGSWKSGNREARTDPSQEKSRVWESLLNAASLLASGE